MAGLEAVIEIGTREMQRRERRGDRAWGRNMEGYKGRVRQKGRSRTRNKSMGEARARCRDRNWGGVRGRDRDRGG